MVHAVIDMRRRKVERVYPVNAPSVEPEFVWVAAPLVVGVNPAGLTEIVFRGLGVELIDRQIFSTLGNSKLVQSRAGNECRPPTA